MKYLLPTRNYRIAGDTHAAHINDYGRPLCGAALSEPYEAGNYLCAYHVCPDCARTQDRQRLGYVQFSFFEGIQP